MTKDEFYVEIDKATLKIFNKMSLYYISNENIEDIIHKVSIDLLRNIKASQVKNVEVKCHLIKDPFIVFRYLIKFKNNYTAEFLISFDEEDD